ncbi:MULTISPECIES: hypothetical protein [unclassified Lentimicrobium]|uniref:hypothetical protein n=1 Tax=unclassified Lentimicrobium TaxID=2677434 RepID=UPI00155771C5|nr:MULTISPECIES: hypothetical protein [unclassified Lentimicrobium]NPD47006.1 hypothetical protein [Lentimicrobium sp. S6]NPD83901.1 hypothetical protein [Lentimicrobium sp. L6]
MQEQKIIIETVGTVMKKEDLVFFENPKNILAFETAHAYPGYNGIVPQNYNPNSIFLITKEQYLTEEVFIHSQNIRKSVEFKFSSAIAYVEYQNKKYPAIRIKDLKNYSFIPELISAYVESGIEFAKKKSVSPFTTLIQVKKEFCLDPIENDCYKDNFDANMSYFEIPNHMTWEPFEKIITDMKYNNSGMNYDAALSLFYRASKVVFAVRIFKEGLTKEELFGLKEQFYKRL